MEDCDSDYDCDKIGIPEDLRPKSSWVYDSVSLMQGSGDANLDIWYDSSYVSGEKHIVSGAQAVTSVLIERTPILAGTLLGQIYKNNTLIYNFSVHSSGLFNITEVDSPCVKISPDLNITGYSIDNITGYVNFHWAAPPGPLEFIVNYEFNCEMKV